MSVKPDEVATARPTTHAGWAEVLAPHGFKPASATLDRHLWDRRQVYFIQFQDMVKVGVAFDVQKRLNSFRLACPRGLYLRAVREVPALLAIQAERQIHAVLKPHAVGREWFRLGSAEARKLAEPVIDRAWSAVHALASNGYDEALQ